MPDTELTQAQINRLDMVDNAIYSLVLELTGKSAEELEWDIAWIAEIADAVQTVVCDDLKLMTEMEFRPYVERN